LKLSLFSVQDHYADGTRTVPQLYKQHWAPPPGSLPLRPESRREVLIRNWSLTGRNRTHAHAAHSNQFLKRLPSGMLPG
jgi:hypothetical protein